MITVYYPKVRTWMDRVFYMHIVIGNNYYTAHNADMVGRARKYWSF